MQVFPFNLIDCSCIIYMHISFLRVLACCFCVSFLIVINYLRWDARFNLFFALDLQRFGNSGIIFGWVHHDLIYLWPTVSWLHLFELSRAQWPLLAAHHRKTAPVTYIGPPRQRCMSQTDALTHTWSVPLAQWRVYRLSEAYWLASGCCVSSRSNSINSSSTVWPYKQANCSIAALTGSFGRYDWRWVVGFLFRCLIVHRSKEVFFVIVISMWQVF